MASQRSTEILEEMVALSVDVINICQSLHLPRSVLDQLTRSVTSIGANFTEAQDASSKKDFLNKIYITKKEAAETKYWLTIVARLSQREFASQIQETQRLVMMFQKIINTSKESNRRSSIANASGIAK